MSDKKNIPDPKEVQKEIEKLIKDRFGENIQIVAQEINVKDEDEPIDVDGDEIEENQEFDLTFEYKPKEIKEYLDKYVITQDDAKKALAIAVCDHYNFVRKCHEAKQNEIELDDDNYSKQNVLMLGPTGVGKTYLVKIIAKLIGVPFVKADATRFTETGYVGANVDDLVRDLVSMADGNIELAQYGIIYFDEADKLAGASNSNGRDISGRGVQYGLLKLMEETEIDLRSAHDMISQMQAFMDFQKRGKVTKKIINTKHILFIVSGAFSGLEDIITKRLKTNTIGLTSTHGKNKKKEKPDNLFEFATTQDFIDFGFEPEFIGRLPVRLSCLKLTVDNLYDILKDSKESIIHQYIDSFAAYGISLYFRDEALKKIAQLAFAEKTGARALMTVCEKIFREFKFTLPSTKINAFVASENLIINPQAELDLLLKDKNYGPKSVFKYKVIKEEQRLFEEQGIKVTFDDSALEQLYLQSIRDKKDLMTLYQDIFKSYIFGLKIIQKNTKKREFILTKNEILNPTDSLEKWIKSSYDL